MIPHSVVSDVALSVELKPYGFYFTFMHMVRYADCAYTVYGFTLRFSLRCAQPEPQAPRAAQGQGFIFCSLRPRAPPPKSRV